MKSTRFLVIATALVFLLACQKKTKPDSEAAASASAPATQDTIQVGLIASLTGKFSALGSEDKKAVELAIEQVNAKGAYNLKIWSPQGKLLYAVQNTTASIHRIPALSKPGLYLAKIESKDGVFDQRLMVY